MDVKSAFLQGTALNIDVCMEPPAELKKPGIVWKLKKTVYEHEEIWRAIWHDCASH